MEISFLQFFQNTTFRILIRYNIIFWNITSI